MAFKVIFGLDKPVHRRYTAPPFDKIGTGH